MTETVATRVGEGQRARGDLQPFLGLQGEDVTCDLDSAAAAEQRRSLSLGQLRAIGRSYLHGIFSLHDDEEPDASDGALMHHGDREWIRRRREKLALMSEGRMEFIPKEIWDLAVLLMHPLHQRATFKRFAHRVPSEFLEAAVAVALLRSDGTMRPLDGRRGRSMLALAILMWLLAEVDLNGGSWGYVIRGLPYGAWCELLAFFENYGRIERRAPHVNTVWGTHRVGGEYTRSDCGYMAAFRQAGLIKTKQPPWWAVGASRRGLPRTNAKGEWECWAFVEIRLRIAAPGTHELHMEGHEPWLRNASPPSPTDDCISRNATSLFGTAVTAQQLVLPQSTSTGQRGSQAVVEFAATTTTALDAADAADADAADVWGASSAAAAAAREALLTSRKGPWGAHDGVTTRPQLHRTATAATSEVATFSASDLDAVEAELQRVEAESSLDEWDKTKAMSAYVQGLLKARKPPKPG